MKKLIIIFFAFSTLSFVAILLPRSPRPCPDRSRTDDHDDVIIAKREIVESDHDDVGAMNETRRSLPPTREPEAEIIVAEKLKRGTEEALSCAEMDVLAAMVRRRALPRRGDGEEWTLTSSPNDNDDDVIMFHYRESDSPGSFRKLRAEIAKRKRHERHLAEVVAPLRASCVDETRRVAWILSDRKAESAVTKLCDDPPLPSKLAAARRREFTDEPCFRLAKFRSLASARGSAWKVVNLARSLACFVAALEDGRLFLEDFHGSNFVVDVTDFTVKLANTESLIFHGDGDSPNLYGGTICYGDQHCGSPMGRYWGRGSANSFFYQTCFSRNFCLNNRCAGFNASLHLCALRRWVIPPVATELMKMDGGIGTSFNEIVATVLDPVLSDPERRGRGGTSRRLCRQFSDLHRQAADR